MDNYDELAEKAWNAILAKVRELDANGIKRAAIAKMLGFSGRSVITNWLKGETTSKAASFPSMLRYLDVLGLDIRDFIPQPKDSQNKDAHSLKQELESIKSENALLREKLLIAETRAKTFQEVIEMQSKSVNDAPDYENNSFISCSSKKKSA